jgi:SAM-dependent methyltransferase
LQVSEQTDLSIIKNALKVLGADDEVITAIDRCEHPYRAGIGFSDSGGSSSCRFYLHSHEGISRKAVYKAWRWNGQGLERFTYHFYFDSNISDRTIFNGIPAQLTSAFEALAKNKLFKQISGYWLRKNGSGLIEQIDIALPWYPLASQLDGVNDIFDALHLSADDVQIVENMHLRHIAFKLIDETPEVTFYTSAGLWQNWPENEADLQQHVTNASVEANRQIESIISTLPPLDDQPKENIIGDFYDGDITAWRQILGPGMHYHMGIFRGDGPFEDEDMEPALIRAVETLYPHLPRGGRIYDIGCGWGGPMAMICRDLNARVLGITPSTQQFQYVSSLGLDVRLGNAEYLLLPGNFDTVLMLESFCHIRHKERLLKVLANFTSKLVMRVNCQDNAPPGKAFDNTMYMISSETLYKLLTETGWKIQHWQDVRMQTLPSIKFWHQRVTSIPFYNDRHMNALKTWSAQMLACPEEWGHNNPLIEVVATRS